MVCINPAFRLYELEYALNKVECNTLIPDVSFKASDYLKMINTLAPKLENSHRGQVEAQKLPYLKQVIRMSSDITPGIYNFEAICAAGIVDDQATMHALQDRLQPDYAINIQCASWRTGNPKGATLSHRNILNDGFLTELAMHSGLEGKLCVPVPVYHCFGMALLVLACVAHGATMVFPGPSFDPEETLKSVEAE